MAPLVLLLAASAAAAAATRPREEAKPPFDGLERRMAVLVNRDRAKHKLPPLIYSARLAAIARAHSQDMHDHNFMGHESPRTGHSKDRVTRAGIPYRAVGENVAYAPTIEVGESALMQSEGHRANILSPQFARVGIGIVKNETNGWLRITQLFVLPPPLHDAEALRTQMIDGMNAARLKKGFRRLLEDADLTREALRHSERAARVGKADPAWLEQRLALDSRRWRIHTALYLLTDKVSDVTGSDVALSPRYGYFGLGVVQSPLAGDARGALWVTLICAQKK
jgi:uncharacterized protein YkwD